MQALQPQINALRTKLKEEQLQSVEGQLEKAGASPGVVRFEANRSLTGMGHERFGAAGLREVDLDVRQLRVGLGDAVPHQADLQGQSRDPQGRTVGTKKDDPLSEDEIRAIRAIRDALGDNFAIYADAANSKALAREQEGLLAEGPPARSRRGRPSR